MFNVKLKEVPTASSPFLHPKSKGGHQLVWNASVFETSGCNFAWDLVHSGSKWVRNEEAVESTT